MPQATGNLHHRVRTPGRLSANRKLWRLLALLGLRFSNIPREHIHGTERTGSPDCRKHLLREELTQSFGLMKDTNDHLGSIFYQPWTCDTRYADIDLQLIHWQLSDEIKAGMTRSDIIAVW